MTSPNHSMTPIAIYRAALEEIGKLEGEFQQCRGCGCQLDVCMKVADKDCIGYVARDALDAPAKAPGLADDPATVRFVTDYVERIAHGSSVGMARMYLSALDAYQRAQSSSSQSPRPSAASTAAE